MLVIITKREDPDQTASSRSSLIWVCTVCLGLFGRQLLVFEVLERLLYTSYATDNINYIDTQYSI